MRWLMPPVFLAHKMRGLFLRICRLVGSYTDPRVGVLDFTGYARTLLDDANYPW